LAFFSAYILCCFLGDSKKDFLLNSKKTYNKNIYCWNVIYIFSAKIYILYRSTLYSLYLITDFCDHSHIHCMHFDFIFMKINNFNCFLKPEYLLSRHLTADCILQIYNRLLDLIIITDEYFISFSKLQFNKCNNHSILESLWPPSRGHANINYTIYININMTNCKQFYFMKLLVFCIRCFKSNLSSTA
jgi:hypothetical protein